VQQRGHSAQERKFTGLDLAVFDIEVAQDPSNRPGERTHGQPAIRRDRALAELTHDADDLRVTQKLDRVARVERLQIQLAAVLDQLTCAGAAIRMRNGVPLGP
jgi:hypothetical protein